MPYFKADELCFSSIKHHHKVFSTTPITQHQFCITDWEPRLWRAYLCFFPETLPWTMSTRVIFPCLHACTAVHSTNKTMQTVRFHEPRRSEGKREYISVCAPALAERGGSLLGTDSAARAELSYLQSCKWSQAEWSTDQTAQNTCKHCVRPRCPRANSRAPYAIPEGSVWSLQLPTLQKHSSHILSALLSMKIPTLWCDTTSLCSLRAYQLQISIFISSIKAQEFQRAQSMAGPQSRHPLSNRKQRNLVPSARFSMTLTAECDKTTPRHPHKTW